MASSPVEYVIITKDLIDFGEVKILPVIDDLINLDKGVKAYPAETRLRKRAEPVVDNTHHCALCGKGFVTADIIRYYRQLYSSARKRSTSYPYRPT